MIGYEINKLSSFIDLVLEYRINEIEFDSYIKRKITYYTMTIDTKEPLILDSKFNFIYGTQKVVLDICPKTGHIFLFKDGYKSYFGEDIEFTLKYSKIIEDNYNKVQIELLDSIIDTSLLELKLQRANNLNKLI